MCVLNLQSPCQCWGIEKTQKVEQNSYQTTNHGTSYMLNEWKLRGYTLYTIPVLCTYLSQQYFQLWLQWNKKDSNYTRTKKSDICSLNHPVGKYIIRNFGEDEYLLEKIMNKCVFGLKLKCAVYVSFCLRFSSDF